MIRAVVTGLALLCFGAALGGAAYGLTSSEYAFLAMPAALAMGWLALANPLACQPDGRPQSPRLQHREDRHGHHAEPAERQPVEAEDASRHV